MAVAGGRNDRGQADEYPRLEVVRGHRRAPTNEFYAIPFRGQRTKLPVIRIDTRDLSYNIELGRLIVDRLTIIDVGADADPEDPKLQKEMGSQILAFRETARDGQLEPGVITSDGYVINGNRRLAILRSLEMTWFWIGSQAEYDRLLGQR